MSVSLWVPLWLTVKVSALATLTALVAGVGSAVALGRVQGRARYWVDSLLMLPMVLPPTVVGYFLLAALGRRGWLGAWLYETLGVSVVFTWLAAVLAAAVVSYPVVYRAAATALAGVDRGLQDAARSLGKPEASVFLRVTLPLAWRGIAAGTLLAVARAMGEFGATLMVAGNLPGRTQTLPLAIYEAVQAGAGSSAARLVLLTCVASTLLLAGSGWLVAHRRERLP